MSEIVNLGGADGLHDAVRTAVQAFSAGLV